MFNIFKAIYEFFYWIIFGEKPFKPNKDAYFIHVYKKRQIKDKYIGLNTSALITVEALLNAGFNANSFGVDSFNDIDKIIKEENPTHIIVKAFWLKKEEIEFLANKYPNCKILITCHSKASFLASENKGFISFAEVIELSKKYNNVFAASNNKDMATNIEKAFDSKVLFLPNLTTVNNDIKINSVNNEAFKVGLFCAIRPMKNMLNQALAAISYCQENNKVLELHVLSGRTEMQGSTTIKNIRDLFNNLDSSKYKLVEHNWYKHSEFIELVKQMNIGLQASFTESFNLVSVDFIKSGVPVVTSPAIDWAPKLSQANPDNITEIKNKIKKLTKKSNIKKFIRKGVKNLKEYNKNGFEIYNKITKL